MILHLLHIFFTLARTFMKNLRRPGSPTLLFVTPGYPTAVGVVRRNLDLYTVARQYPHEMHPHLTADMGEYYVAVIELYAEHRIRKRFDYRTFYLYLPFFGQIASSFREPTAGSK
jgi:hypothetical protein